MYILPTAQPPSNFEFHTNRSAVQVADLSNSTVKHRIAKLNSYYYDTLL
jgi:hypothetical protein